MGPGGGRQHRPRDAVTGPPPASRGLPNPQLIDECGPFVHERDGRVLGNVEGLPPRRGRGHHRAYTVPTPGSDDRGARRIVTGRNGGTYYTDDHYASFTAVPR